MENKVPVRGAKRNGRKPRFTAHVPPVCCSFPDIFLRKKFYGIAGTDGTPVRLQNLADFRAKKEVILYRQRTGGDSTTVRTLC